MADIINDFIDLSKADPKTPVLESLNAKEQDYVKLHKPFDARNARLAFYDYCEDHVKQCERAASTNRPLPSFKTDWDWSEYGKSDRFKLITERKVIERNTKVGLLTPTLIGYDQDFIVKPEYGGGKQTVFTPLDEWKGKKE